VARKPTRPVFTYQTRLLLSPEQDAALQAWAELMGRAERRLFALRQGEARGRAVPTATGKDGQPIPLKRRLRAEFGLTGRQFNAVERQLEGRIKAIQERRPGLIEESEARIAMARKLVAKLAREGPGSAKLHQKRRRLATLEARQTGLLADEAAGEVRLCFGSKRLFRAQFALEENGYADLDAWRADWRAARADQITILGSGDEVCGNQTAQLRRAADGTLALTLKLPPGVVAAANPAVLDRLGRLTVRGLRFAYGQDRIEAALAQSRRVQKPSRTSDKVFGSYEGVAITTRVQRDAKGWRLLASLEVAAPERVTSRANGALGLDINEDHLAMAEIDRSGNPVRVSRIELPLAGLSANPAQAMIEGAALEMARRARALHKPLVIEALDFQRKKAEAEAVSPRRARKLSALAYRKVQGALRAAAFRAGVEVVEVNPAYTSTIGAVNHAARLGISTHQGAATAIARRGLGLSERPAWAAGERAKARVPLRDGTHVTLPLPARNRERHVWGQWAAIRRELKAAQQAHWRSAKAKAGAAPRPPRARRATCQTPVGTRGDSPLHRSGGDRDFIPQLAE
jgi:IS605 OrfB family transposase